MKSVFRALTWNIILFGIASQLSAQATRTWVSGVGDDANPCSRTAPCKTFAGAISKTAAGGEIDAIDPGGFGAVTITKAITIDGGGGIVAGVLASGFNGIVINAGVNDFVVLRNLQINGAVTQPGTDTRGIKFLAGLRLLVENCDISNTGKRGISIESSTQGAVATIVNTSVHNNLNNGIIVSPPANITNHVILDHVQSVNNNFFGLGTNVGAVVQVRNSVISNNAAGGLLADNSTVDVNDTLINSNGNFAVATGTGITSQNGATVRLGATTVTGNNVALSITGGATIASYGDNYFGGTAVGLTSVSRQ